QRTPLEWLSHPRFEVIPFADTAERVRDAVPTEVTVTVTASPTKGIEATLDLSLRLAAEGYPVVPHLSARLVHDTAHLKDILSRLHGAGVREVFVVAGDVQRPAGEFAGALPLLEAMAELGPELEPGLERIGIAGYPESHPFIEDDITIQSMWDKRRYASYIVSQVCFDPKTLGGWVRRVRRRGVQLPIYVGMPAPIDRLKLMRISAKIGIGESARFLRGHRNWLWRLMLPGGYSPDRFLAGLLPFASEPDSGLAGLHVYTFNELEQAERWRADTIVRLRGAT
ncbi:MAG TPA: methylenetetrahydrofolate reductase, partial [Kribbellaceae bacterium]